MSTSSDWMNGDQCSTKPFDRDAEIEPQRLAPTSEQFHSEMTSHSQIGEGGRETTHNVLDPARVRDQKMSQIRVDGRIRTTTMIRPVLNRDVTPPTRTIVRANADVTSGEVAEMDLEDFSLTYWSMAYAMIYTCYRYIWLVAVYEEFGTYRFFAVFRCMSWRFSDCA